MKPTWKWNEGQRSIIDQLRAEIHSDDDTIRMFIHGGLGSGKSIAILFLIDMICQNTPGMNALIVRRTFESLKTDTFNILKRSPGILDASKGVWKENGKQFHYFNGSTIHFGHLEKSDALFGPSYGLIYVEQIELCAEDDYRLLRDRLRQFSANHTYHSQYAEYIDKKQLLPAKNYLLLSANPRNCWVKEKLLEDDKNKFVKIHVPTYVNKHNLPKDYINENESEAYKRRFYEGLWESLSGLCYPEFTDQNLVDLKFELKNFPFDKQLSSYNLSKFQNYIIVDPGMVTSKFAVMFATVLADGTIYLFDEISRNGKDVDETERVQVPEIAGLIKDKIKSWGLGEYIGIIDYAANAPSAGAASITNQFNKAGIFLSNSIKSIGGTKEIDVIFYINSLFKQKKILVNPRCIATLRELELFSWKTDRNGVPKKEEPADKDNDFMDCLRYLINAGPSTSVNLEMKQSWSEKDVMGGYMQNLFSDVHDTSKELRQNPLVHKKTALDFGLY